MICYVTGNHESRVGEYSQLKEQMESLGINILDNKAIVLKQKESIINLIGIDDPKFSNKVAVSDNEIIRTEIHGGQIRIPFVGGIIAPNQGFLPKYIIVICREDNFVYSCHL